MVDEPDTPLEFRAQPSAPYLLFGIKGTVYGVHVRHVHEIVLLPEVQMLAERSGHFIGAVNLRGEIVPVIDLELRFGRKLGQYALNDYLLVLESDDRPIEPTALAVGNSDAAESARGPEASVYGSHKTNLSSAQRVAVIVNDVLGVKEVDPAEHKAGEDSGDSTLGASCVERMASVDDQIVMLLDISSLLSSSSLAPGQTIDEYEAESPSFVAAASEADLAVFRRRAIQLRQSSLGLEAEELMSLAVAEIGEEFYAFELDFVREFFEVQDITPVPCCPAKILGNINLRGDVVTVVDIRGDLNLPVEGRVTEGKVVIAHTDEMTVGVLVDALHGVIYLPVAEIINVAGAANLPIKGTAPFHETMMSILDVPSLLALNSWVVDEEVGHS